MKLAWGQPGRSEAEAPAATNVERWLTLMAEGAALSVPEVDPAGYREFRTNVGRLTLQLPDRLPEDDKLALVRAIVHEFENYRKNTEDTLRERLGGWRGAAAILLEELLKNLGVDPTSSPAAALRQEVRNLTTAEEIQAWRTSLQQFLYPLQGQSLAEHAAARLRAADRSTANDNAAGLRGGGSAVEHVRKVMDRGGEGFIALFRLSCLEVINQRFGPEAVEDCLMAVSAFLTDGLQSDDAIYHWSDSTLLAVLRGRTNEMILTAELQRIVSQNRESSINVAGRAIMLRIPLSFELFPINRLRTAEDLYRISTSKEAKR